MRNEKKDVCLTLENVSKVFAKVESDEVTHALQDVSATMKSGEFVSLVGPSGCGKSTILRLVAGLILPTLGRVTVDGAEVETPSPERGVVFQNPTLFPWLTVEKNIAFSLDVRGMKDGKAERVDQMIRMIGLERFRNDYPAQLSGGMAQRVALVRTLINDSMLWWLLPVAFYALLLVPMVLLAVGILVTGLCGEPIARAVAEIVRTGVGA